VHACLVSINLRDIPSLPVHSQVHKDDQQPVVDNREVIQHIRSSHRVVVPVH
jgi:hypothetical protein